MASSVHVAEVNVPSGLYIGGKWIDGRGPPLESINPATEEAIASITTANSNDIDNAVAAARECFETQWGTNTSGQKRGQLMLALADALEAAIDEIAKVESADSGKPLAWCKIDNEDAVACYRYFAGLADKIHGTTIELDDQEKYATTRKEPIGVVAQIVPWNYPSLMAAWKIAPALAAGCAIVFKPAETTPLATQLFAKVFDGIGFPTGTFNVVNGLGTTVGDALCRHPDVDKIAFTGSTATGRRILKAAAESNLKGVTLELGGKSANIVFDDAKLEDAAKWAAFGVYENMGQSCSAGSRVLVQEGVYDKFLELFVQATQAIKVGDPGDRETFQGPQVNKVQFDKILAYLKAGKESGARVVTGGDRHGNKGYFVQPTVFADVSMDMAIAKEEIFGPVACVIKFKTEEEAMKVANGTEYGLAAAVHTNGEFFFLYGSSPKLKRSCNVDIRRANRTVRKLKAGTVWVNQYVMLSHQVPFGGYKQSGWGRELGVEGIEAYLQTKSVHHYYGEGLEWPIIV